MTYAREGYRFYSVITPQFFAEFELPEDLDGRLTASQERQLQQLEDAAERHGTSIKSSAYRLG